MIIYLHGPDTYRSRTKMRELIDRFRGQADPSGLNIDILDASDQTIGDLANAVGAAPFISNKRMIVAQGFLTKFSKAEDQAKLDSLLNKETDNVLLIWESEDKPVRGRRKADSQLVTKLKKEKYAQAFSVMNPAQATAWVQAETVKRKGKIDYATASQLVAAVGTDTWQLHNELEKLLAYSGQNEIKIADIEELTQAQVDADIFALTDALGRKNRKNALALIEQQFAAGTAPLELLGKIVWQFKNLLLVRDALDSNPGYPVPAQLANELGLHPFVVKKTLPQAAKYNLGELQSAYAQLLEIDKQLKQSGEPRVLFTKLAASL
tara:strand:+ start:984 stop:1949 length:966 start_codon:yes stop_codon:yes gene_type:complete